jgi:hypothetical protein
MKRTGTALQVIAAAAFLSAAMCGEALAQSATGQASSTAYAKGLSSTFVSLLEAHKALAGGGSISIKRSTIRGSPDAAAAEVISAAELAAAAGSTLPLWTFSVRSPRDGHHHEGVMVGTNPFSSPGTSTIPTQIIPLIFRVHSVAVSFDPTTGIITTRPGHATFDPTVADDNCLSEPNNVPVTLMNQSPIFQPASFTFGSTSVGTTQYIDAFQRANFYSALGSAIDSYHVLLGPVQTLEPVEIDVPANEALAITDPNFFGPPAFCPAFGIVDINWLDYYLNDRLLPQLAGQGVGPTTLPVFLMYNMVGAAPANNLANCCALGYHSFGGFPTPTQTYAVADFDSTQAFGPTVTNTDVISHEVGEWVNDPFGNNLLPPWGGTGQVPGCQANLEVGDPLTGTNVPSVTMPNGFAYNLQELAFFSWFFGGTSIGINGWYSNNGTFMTDAGRPCSYQ